MRSRGPSQVRRLAFACVVGLGCRTSAPDGEPSVGGTPTPAQPAGAESEAQAEPVALTGIWRAVLNSPGGELPFRLELREDGQTLLAVAHNGEETVEFSKAVRDGDNVVLRIDGYDSTIEARLGKGGRTLEGEWTKTIPEGKSRLPFVATRGDSRRFAGSRKPPAHPVPESIAGAWAVTFTEDDGSTFVGRAQFEDKVRIDATEPATVTGTFLTDTGDYRYLEGRYTAGTLELSCFDGGHAFLFRAQVQQSGTLAGEFWSRDRYHATWTARPLGPDERDELADPYSITRLTDDDGRFRFAFDDLQGRQVTSEDRRFEGKVVLVDIFGTWCPNCNDYAPILAHWDRRYRDRGLRIVGLAFEMTGDTDRDRDFVEQFGRTHGIEFPLLLAGISDKATAGKTLSSIDKVAAYPTTVFVGRDGKVSKIHSGFAGPATGDHHRALVSELEAEIERLLGDG